MGYIIDKAEEYLAEAEAQDDKNPEKKDNIAYWRAFLVGARAQQRESKNQERPCEGVEAFDKIQAEFMDSISAYAKIFEELSGRIERLAADLSAIVESGSNAGTGVPMVPKGVETPESHTTSVGSVYSYGTFYSVDSVD